MNKNDFQATLNWYEQNAKTYASKIADKPDLFLLDRFLEEIPNGGSILDAGSAGGRDCKIFLERGYSPTGIDAVKSLVEEAKSINPGIDFVHGNFLNLPFDDSSFDGLWSHASLLHLEEISDVKQSLKEFFRVLKSGGIAHIFVKQQMGKEKTSNVSHDYSGEFSRFFRWYEKEELENLLKDVGFEILDSKDNYTPKDGRKNIKWLAILAQKTK
jgi:ubiquinone/menaquinone biosynthesis C-methylase UbiE